MTVLDEDCNCYVRSANRVSVERWCKQNLSSQYRVREFRDYTRTNKGIDFVVANVVTRADRERLHESFEIAYSHLNPTEYLSIHYGGLDDDS